MDNKTPQYQRAVTPTIDNINSGNGQVRGKVLNYSANSKLKLKVLNSNPTNNTLNNVNAINSSNVKGIFS
jgi:hypothetical protein